MRIAIVGAGLAGLACAARLTEGGHDARLFDKGRRPGGRMSSRRVATASGEAGFDHGAQYFTVRDAGFRARVDAWHRDGLVAPWPAAGPDCWVGVPAMNAPVKRLAGTASVRWNTRVDSISGGPGDWVLQGDDGLREGPFDAALLAVPSENTSPLLSGVAPAMAARAGATPAQPCWTVMAAFSAKLPVASDVLREDGLIGWAARNSAKPGRTGPEAWVIQAGPAWSRDHLEEAPADIVPKLLAALGDRIGAPLPAVLTASAHRWRYARSGNAGFGMMWDPALRLGVCGDWLLGPRVECAWMSGDQLADAVLASLPNPGWRGARMVASERGVGADTGGCFDRPPQPRTPIMVETPDEAALTLEFDVFAKRAGLDIPADRRPMVYAGFKDLRRMLTLLRQPRDATHEPAGAFSILSVTRGLGA